jgi:hypothetical protein
MVRPFAVLAVLAVLLGRAIGPSMAGIGVGMDRIIPAVEFIGKIVSQLFAMSAIVLAMAEILTASKSRLPSVARLGSLGFGGVVILVSLLASPRREILPPLMVGLLALAAALLALLAAVTAWHAPFARAAALVVGLVGLAGVIRLLAVALAYQTAEPRWARLAEGARGIATLGFLVDTAAVLLATVWVASRGRKLVSPVVLVVLGLALLLTQQALRADLEDAGMLSLLIRRAAEHLMTRPTPLLPMGPLIFVAVLAPLVAVAALGVRSVTPPGDGSAQPTVSAPIPPAIRGVLALALLVRGAPEMPLSGLLLVVAAVSVALASRDDRGVWEAIKKVGGPTPPTPSSLSGTRGPRPTPPTPSPRPGRGD